jgi:hypothetical protein
MDKCKHIWLYIGSKRQKLWRCTLCDEYRLDDPSQKREWVGLTHEEKMDILTRSITAPSRIEVAEALLKEKNSG